MSLKVTLEIAERELRLQQGVACKFQATNVGKEPIRVVVPSPGASMPVWHVVSLRDGSERVLQNKPSLFSPARETELAPGASVSMGAKLNEFVPFPEPGEYDVTIEYQWNGGAGSAKSEPVRLKILGGRPRWGDVASISGGISGQLRALWVDQTDDGAQLMISPLDIDGKRPKVRGVHALGKIKESVRPVLSVPANGQLYDRHWIAWLDGRMLDGFPVADDNTRPPKLFVKPMELPDVPTFLASPLLPVPERSEETAAAVLIQTGKGGKSNIQVAIIEADGSLAEGPAGPIHDGAPVWVKGVAFREGDRRIFVAAQTGPEGKKETTLQSFDWRLKANDLPLTGGVKLPGEHVGSGLVLTMDDMVRGASIVSTSPALRSWQLWLCRWSHGLHGDHESQTPMPIDWDPTVEPREARVALDDQGNAFALIRGGDGLWRRWRSDDLATKPISDPAGHTDNWLDLVMLGQREPLIVLALPPYGLQFFGLEGMGVALPAHP